MWRLDRTVHCICLVLMLRADPCITLSEYHHRVMVSGRWWQLGLYLLYWTKLCIVYVCICIFVGIAWMGWDFVLFTTSCSVCSYTLQTSLSQLAWLQCSTPVICHTPPSITQCLCDTITHSPLPPRQHGRNMCGTYPCNVTKILLMGAEIGAPSTWWHNQNLQS